MKVVAIRVESLGYNYLSIPQRPLCLNVMPLEWREALCVSPEEDFPGPYTN
jgi:hypothetical protein